MVLSFFSNKDGTIIGKPFRFASKDQMDFTMLVKALKITEDEAKAWVNRARSDEDTPFYSSKVVYAATKEDAEALIAKNNDPDEEEKSAADDFSAMPAGDQHFSNALSFAIKNRAINLSAVRSGFKTFKKWHNGTEEGKSLIRQFIALGISAVARRKEDFATALMPALQALGDVPIVFAGAGGTFKAWLYLGYDIMLHWTYASPQDHEGVPSMKQIIENVSRVAPGGDVRKSSDREVGGNQKIVERNRALAAARTEFASWAYDKDLFVDFVQSISGRKVVNKEDNRKGTITPYVPGQKGNATRT